MRLTDCERPENIEGPTAAAWAEINAHLGSMAKNLPEMVEQLGQHSFDHTPRVGDSFCGGGSIPFKGTIKQFQQASNNPKTRAAPSFAGFFLCHPISSNRVEYSIF